jgi:hypothetical protein
MTNRFILRQSTRGLLLSLAAMLLTSGLLRSAEATNYRWKQVKLGAGGLVTGLVMHPLDGDIKYIRTDVGGAYRWNAKSDSWEQIITSESMPHDYVRIGSYFGVAALAVNARDKDSLYIAYGNQDDPKAAPRYNGNVFKSEDRGGHFIQLGELNAKLNSNGDRRQDGERLAVDPFDEKRILFGSSEGAHWYAVAIPGAPSTTASISVILFDPSAGKDANGRCKVAYVAVVGAGVFQTTDAGATWNSLAGKSEKEAPQVVHGMDLDNKGVLYVAADGGAWRCEDGEWKDISPLANHDYVTVTVDPFDFKRVFFEDRFSYGFLTLDQGETFSPRNLGVTLLSPDIPWLSALKAWDTSRAAFNPSREDELWTTSGQAVWKVSGKDIAGVADPDTKNLSIPWISQAAGIEEQVGFDVIKPPGGDLVCATADNDFFATGNPDSYTAVAQGPNNPTIGQNSLACATSVAFQWDNPSFIVGASASVITNGDIRSGFSTDGGKTWNRFESIVQGSLPKAENGAIRLQFGNIAVSTADPKNMVWHPAHNVAPDNGYPWFTFDQGATWERSALHGFNSEDIGGWTASLWQDRRGLVADPAPPPHQNIFYLYVWSGPKGGSIAYTTDGGRNFSIACAGIPAWCYHPQMAAVKDRAGDVWFASGCDAGSGLWHLSHLQAGEGHAQQIPGFGEVYTVAVGKSRTADGYPTVFAMGTYEGEYGIYRSTDEGETWVAIGKYPLGLFDKPVCAAGDWDTFGRLYLGFGGNSWIYGDEASGGDPP